MQGTTNIGTVVQLLASTPHAAGLIYLVTSRSIKQPSCWEHFYAARARATWAGSLSSYMQIDETWTKHPEWGHTIPIDKCFRAAETRPLPAQRWACVPEP